MMIPFAALMIPLFTMFGKAGLLDTHLAVIMPTVAGAFIIFYFRQCTKTFPKELIDAARVEGVAEWKIFGDIYVPVMKASYAAAFVIVFMASWNLFSMAIDRFRNQTNLKTINLVLSSFASAYSPDFGLIMVGMVISTLPSLIIFFAMQKQFVASMTGACKIMREYSFYLIKTGSFAKACKSTESNAITIPTYRNSHNVVHVPFNYFNEQHLLK